MEFKEMDRPSNKPIRSKHDIDTMQHDIGIK